MNITFSDFKKGKVSLKITSPEDLWYLHHIIEPGDTLSGKTTRKITIGGTDEKTSHSIKKVYLEISVEKIEFSESNLRVSGKVTGGAEDVSRGSYHTFSLEQNTECSLIKTEWLSFHKSYLDDAINLSHSPIIICVFDRDDALISSFHQHNIKVLKRLKGDPQKKDERVKGTSNLYKTIITALVDSDKRLKPDFIIVASPAFYKEDLMKQVTDKEFRKKIILATCSSVSKNALTEVIKRPETKHAFTKMRIAEESRAVEEVLAELSTNGKVAYGFSEVEGAAEAGAITKLLVTTTFIHESQLNKTFEKLNVIMKRVDTMKGTILIINSEHPSGKKLHGLSGIAALLRFKLQ